MARPSSYLRAGAVGREVRGTWAWVEPCEKLGAGLELHRLQGPRRWVGQGDCRGEQATVLGRNRPDGVWVSCLVDGAFMADPGQG